MTTPRDWADIPEPSPDGDPWTSDPTGAVQGLLLAVALAVPLWAVIAWAVATVPGWVLSSADWWWGG